MNAAHVILAMLTIGVVIAPVGAEPPPQNALIDFEGFLRQSKEVRLYRESRRLSETEFLQMSREPNTIVLDTRSAEAYQRVHIRDAVHLNFSDITADSLKKTIPNQQTRVLIYCNNNFYDGVLGKPKMAVAALNIPTFVTLYSYGYRNIYELGPALDSQTTVIPLQSKDAAFHNPRDIGLEVKSLSKNLRGAESNVGAGEVQQREVGPFYIFPGDK